MRLIIPTTLMLLLSACATVRPSGEGLCLALAPLADSHVSALLGPDVPGPVIVTGERLIAGLDAGCGK